MQGNVCECINTSGLYGRARQMKFDAGRADMIALPKWRRV